MCLIFSNQQIILQEAFAVVREASKRVLGLRPFDVQLIGMISPLALPFFLELIILSIVPEIETLGTKPTFIPFLFSLIKKKKKRKGGEKGGGGGEGSA